MSGTDEVRVRFLTALGFQPDDFQLRAMAALDDGRSVLVAAPTGSGKTVVAEYAIARAVAEGRKAFYTTPLKALSNQKYGDLIRTYGAAKVGLLTGDNAVNGDAPIVVMTTEVLRNMIYAASASLEGLRYVVLDEVHYLQNAYRGPVWEEVIIHTPPEVDLVCLSATVSNAEEFADWIQTVRGATTAIIEERRPVTLENLYLVGDRSSERLHLLPTLVDDKPNPEAIALDDKAPRGPAIRGRRRSIYTPRRAEVIDLLAERDMLPTIYFIFSRAACNDAVRQCLDFGLRLTTPEERVRIRAIAEAKVEGLSDDDLRVLGYGPWISALEAGISAHHAGLVPPFKEAVEACFAEALVKVVFATETLSLGINMPARSVVIEKLSKFTGERNEFLTGGEYTQLTGRAGRRGIDEVGYAVVLWSPFVPFDQVARLVQNRTYALTSSFRPTYNMAANLVRRYRPDIAHHLLNLSFAQYRTDAAVVRDEAHLAEAQRTIALLEERARCELGDAEEYRRLVEASAGPRRTRPSTREAVQDALRAVKPGDVLGVPGKAAGRVAVISTTHRRGGDVRLRAISVDRKILSLGPRDFPSPPTPLGRVALPTPFVPNSATFRREVAAELSHVRVDRGVRRERPNRDADDHTPVPHAEHPVAACPDGAAHLRALHRLDRVRGDARRYERQIRSRTESLARQFDRVLRVLEAWGYVEGWALTPAGENLARLYHEADLLVAEAVGAGAFDGLSAPEVAGLASVFTYEARGAGPAPAPWFPTPTLRERWGAIERSFAELQQAEREAGLPLTREPDPGFIGLAHGWAAGEDLSRLMAEEEMSGGDFVRSMKQLIDVLRQLAKVAPVEATAAAAGKAADLVFRGVVAASSTVPTA